MTKLQLQNIYHFLNKILILRPKIASVKSFMSKHPWRKNGPFIFPHVPEARVVSNKNLGIKASRNVEILTFNGVIFEKMASKDFGKAYLVRVVCCHG